MAFFRLPRFNFHHAKWSDWYLGSPSGSGINFGTPEIKIAVDSNSIRIPLTEIKEGKVTRSIILKGDGIGVGASVGLQVPFVNVTDSPKELPGTKVSTPGVGSRIRYSMFSPDPMEPRDFKGVCWVLSVSHTDVGVQGSGAMIIFAGEISPYSVLPTSLNASAFSAGIGVASALVNIGADAVVYTLRLG